MRKEQAVSAVARSKPEVSVLMVTRNCPEFIREAVGSIQDQTLRNIEIIIVDESTDGKTRAILRGMAKRDKRIVLREETGLRMSGSLNLALRLSRAPFIARMDGDDVSLPERLERQLRFLKAHPKVGIVGCQADLIDAKGTPLGAYARMPLTDRECKEMMIKRSPFIHPSIMARKSAMREYSVEFTVAEDYELFARIMRSTVFANMPDTLLLYRWDYTHNGSFVLGKKTEWKPIVIRWRMIRDGRVPRGNIVHLIRPLVSFLIPMRVKIWILRRMHGTYGAGGRGDAPVECETPKKNGLRMKIRQNNYKSPDVRRDRRRRDR